MKEAIIKTICNEKLIAIVRGIKAEKTLKVADALYEGGLRLIEITFDQKNPDGWKTTAEAISMVAEKYEGRMKVGAGTVVSAYLTELAAKAGAEYIISPDLNLEVVRRTKELGLVSIPGVLTPTEIMSAYNAGADFVKLFPAADLGVSYVKAVRAPISHVPMLAVGGINEKNLASFLDTGILGAGIGGNLVNREWIDAGEYKKITVLAKKLVEIVKGYRK